MFFSFSQVYNTVEFSHFKCSVDQFYWLYSHVTSTIIKVYHLKHFFVLFKSPFLIWPQAATALLSLQFSFFRILCKWNPILIRSLCAWSLSLSIMLLRFIYLYVSVVFSNCWVVVHTVNIAQFAYLSISWWTFGFQF